MERKDRCPPQSLHTSGHSKAFQENGKRLKKKKYKSYCTSSTNLRLEILRKENSMTVLYIVKVW